MMKRLLTGGARTAIVLETIFGKDDFQVQQFVAKKSVIESKIIDKLDPGDVLKEEEDAELSMG